MNCYHSEECEGEPVQFWKITYIGDPPPRHEQWSTYPYMYIHYCENHKVRNHGVRSWEEVTAAEALCSPVLGS